MADKFKNKYRIPSARLQTWDYSNNASYFLTICTKNRKPYFGEIKDGIMVLSHAGVIANLMWYEIKNHAKNLELGEFVIMPDHVHGILILDNLETGHALSLNPMHPAPITLGQQRYQNQGKTPFLRSLVLTNRL